MNPRGIHYVIGIYLFFTILALTGAFEGRPGDEALDELERSSVYIEPNAGALIDAREVSRIVGDRPLVVAAVGDHASVSCGALGDALPRVIALVVSTDGDFEACASDPTPIYYESSLHYDTEDLLAFAEHDATDLITEYVRLFDAKVASVLSGEPAPRRPPPPEGDGPDAEDVIPFVGLAIVFGGIALFGAYVVRQLWHHTQRARAKNRQWRAETNARLNRLADLVLRPGEPKGPLAAERQAGIAKDYVLTLERFEKTRSPSDELEHMMTDLEAAVLLVYPDPAPRPRRKRKLRHWKRERRRRKR